MIVASFVAEVLLVAGCGATHKSAQPAAVMSHSIEVTAAQARTVDPLARPSSDMGNGPSEYKITEAKNPRDIEMAVYGVCPTHSFFNVSFVMKSNGHLTVKDTGESSC